VARTTSDTVLDIPPTGDPLDERVAGVCSAGIKEGLKAELARFLLCLLDIALARPSFDSSLEHLNLTDCVSCPCIRPPPPRSLTIAHMAFSKSKRLWAIVATLFFLGLVPYVLASPNPSQLPANDIRRRSGSPHRPAIQGPPRKRDGGIPLVVSNRCSEPLWPGIETQAGTGPGTRGFLLSPGTNRTLTVGEDWTGRVWGRTNCSFNTNGTASSRGSGPACDTGDCAGLMSCAGPVSSFFRARKIRC
jgi:hypothetical protein